MFLSHSHDMRLVDLHLPMVNQIVSVKLAHCHCLMAHIDGIVCNKGAFFAEFESCFGTEILRQPVKQLFIHQFRAFASLRSQWREIATSAFTCQCSASVAHAFHPLPHTIRNEAIGFGDPVARAANTIQLINANRCGR